MIINGTFPLKYINHKFLLKQRDIIKRAYNNMKYKYISLNRLKKWIASQLKPKKLKKTIKNNTSIKTNKNPTIKKPIVNGGTNMLYTAMSEDCDNQIEVSDNFRTSRQEVLDFLGITSRKYVNCYTDSWMAILASVPNVHKKIKKGYVTKNGKVIPYIEEIQEEAFDNLNESCFLYTIKKIPSIKKIHNHKYKSRRNVDILQKTYIPNMYNELKNNGVRFIKFKN